MNFDLKNSIKKLNAPCQWFAIKHVKEKSTLLQIKNLLPENNYISNSQGVMIEALCDGHIGYAATNNLSISSLQLTLNKAFNLAKTMADYSISKIPDNSEKIIRPENVGSYTSPRITTDKFTTSEIIDILISSNKSLKVSPLINTALSTAEINEIETEYLTSTGTHITQSFFLTSTSFMAFATNDKETQRRSVSGGRGHCFQIGHEAFNKEKFNHECDTTGQQAVELLSATNCPSKTTNLLLAPDQMMLQIHESIGHPLELDRILGDEHNYAGHSFVKLSDFGNLQYGSPLLNVSFDPSEVENQFASYAFDDSGKKATKELLIKNGILQKGLGSTESEFRSKVPGVANFRSSSWNRAPIDRMANINIEPGESTIDEIISSTESGIYMQSNLSWSIDDYRNKFQFGCEYAKLIEDGKITKTVKNPNYNGVSSSFWKSLSKVGDQSTFESFGTPFCGKGEPNQIIRVGHASPHCLFKNVSIFGGES